MEDGDYGDISVASGVVTVDNYTHNHDSTYAASGHNHSGVYDPAGTAASAVSTHVGQSDPHTQYVLESAIGTNVQAYDAGLQSIAGLVTAADRMIYTTASDTYAVATLTAAGRAILDDADAAAQCTTLGAMGRSAVTDLEMNNYRIYEIKRATFNGEYDNGSKSSAFTIDLANGQKQKATFTSTGALTVTVSNLSVGNYLFKFVNAGLRTITFSPAMKWAGGTAPTLTSSGTDLISVYTDGTNLYGSALLDVK
jgi:hypothetical protein